MYFNFDKDDIQRWLESNRLMSYVDDFNSTYLKDEINTEINITAKRDDKIAKFTSEVIKPISQEDKDIIKELVDDNDYTVVKSAVKGLKQHNCNTWQCFGSFLEEGKLSKFSIKINNKIKSWNKKYSDEKLEKMIITFFSILENNNIESFYELKKMSWSQIVKLINEVSGLDEETKKLYFKALKELILTK